MDSLIQTITPLVEQYGVLGVFFLSLIEEIVAPVPSSLVLMAAGFFLIPQGTSAGETLVPAFLEVIIPATVGLTIGALFIYSVAYLGGKPLVLRWGKLLGVTWEKLERAEARFAAGAMDEIIIFGLRAVPVTPNFLISAICGLVRYPVREFIVLTLLGSFTRATLMGFAGWSLGAAYVRYAEQLSAFTNLIGALIIIFLITAGVFLVVRRKAGKRAENGR